MMYSFAYFLYMFLYKLLETKVDEDEMPKPWAEPFPRTPAPRFGRHPPRKEGYKVSTKHSTSWTPQSARIL